MILAAHHVLNPPVRPGASDGVLGRGGTSTPGRLQVSVCVWGGDMCVLSLHTWDGSGVNASVLGMSPLFPLTFSLSPDHIPCCEGSQPRLVTRGTGFPTVAHSLHLSLCLVTICHPSLFAGNSTDAGRSDLHTATVRT